MKKKQIMKKNDRIMKKKWIMKKDDRIMKKLKDFEKR